ncbi:MAG: 1-acyl-sn-glycerol-3-phosphate acyltransferase [Bacteroidales bacterium]|nr:1-acyl-sn-glycerol-3-phosphate acyltransferase [Bacteroidales bacterium]MDD5975898.1 1-acyl-sn-glycerol-3-phosphate acyltransferase [Bacteroidales bacterium]MDY5193753.1 1-acyl-sn-glycerol-3-phosphate acyltransferase [Candidatus Aphodosoma sp.]
MKNLISKKLLSLFKWELDTSIELPKKCVVCIAPHTSNWDFIVGILFKYATNLQASFFMKKEWFRFPLSIIMKLLGGIPIDRSKKNNVTDIIAEEFNKRDSLIIGLTPEGTRSLNYEWKKGFYYIAQKANVPIVLAYIDFKKKKVGYNKLLIPTNYEDDIIMIKKYYSNINAKYPEKFGCKI